ncbi:helix-turn-helix domain-containing protein, partial [Streptomyces huiliensis]|uniref:helix-turn-helix domain-containing protein n=1 Tax=Streptomyces huiliensis TaxID=2876027 RepID=UPI001CBACD48
ALCGALAPGAALLRLAARSAGGTEAGAEESLHASRAALMLGRTAVARELVGRALGHAGVGRPSPAVLLGHAALVELVADEYRKAGTYARRGLDLALATGGTNPAAQLHATLAVVTAVEGDADACRAHARQALATARAHGLAVPALLASWGLGLLALARNEPSEAVRLLRPLVAGCSSAPHHFAWRLRVVPYFVEAVVPVVRALPAGERERTLRQARAGLRAFEEWGRAAADPRARATALHCRALLGGRDADEPALGAALALLERAGTAFAQGRARLLAGMELRRARRPADACGHLRSAVLRFEECGADAWAARARAELRAAGRTDTAAANVPGPLGALTPQQLRVARHVAQGLTNREVAAVLALSHRTVDHHLRNVFAALGIRSRVQLVYALASLDGRSRDGRSHDGHAHDGRSPAGREHGRGGTAERRLTDPGRQGLASSR